MTHERDLPPVPGAERCIGCGADNPLGLRMRFIGDLDQVEAEVTPPLHFEGYNGYLQGAALTIILDEVQARAAWVRGVGTVTGELTVRFLQPVKLGTPLRAVGRLVEQGRRSYRTAGEVLLPDGQVAALGTGVFVAPLDERRAVRDV